eukprot:PhF_6_TR10779/c0_g1_i1/m.17311
MPSKPAPTTTKSSSSAEYVALLLLLLTVSGKTPGSRYTYNYLNHFFNDSAASGSGNGGDDSFCHGGFNTPQRLQYLSYVTSLLQEVTTTTTVIPVGKQEEDNTQSNNNNTTLFFCVPLDAIVSFGDMHDLLAWRGINRAFRDIVPIDTSSLPSMKGMMFFPFPRHECYVLPHSSISARTKTSSSSVNRATYTQCQRCETWNPSTESLCSNPACRVPLIHRLFIGQLRKEGTAPLLRYLLRFLCRDELGVVHVESHTNPRQRHMDGTPRGKGCAWLCLATAQDARAVQSLHRRVLVDIDVSTGREGVWVCGPKHVSALASYADHKASQQQQQQPDHVVSSVFGVMPRNPLVVEVPLRGSLHNNNTAHHGKRVPAQTTTITSSSVLLSE